MVCCRKFKIFLFFLVFLSFFITSSFATSVSDLEGFYQVSTTKFLSDYLMISNGTFTSQLSANCYYLKFNKGSDYYVISSEHSARIAFAFSLNGSSTVVYDFYTISPGSETYVNKSYIDKYDYLILSYYTDTYVSVYNNSSPLNITVNEVIDVLTIDNVLSILQKCVPLIAVVTLVALGYFIIRRLSKKSSKMKGGV